MSEENVEIVRRIWEVYLEEAATGTRVPAIVGRQGFIEALRAFSDAWAQWTVKPKEFLDAGEDRVVAIVSVSATGKRSGAPVELRFGAVHTLKEGQVVDRRDYADTADALEAAGLSE